MAEASTTKDNVKIEDVGPARKKLTITIPPEVIEQKIAESMQTLAAETVLPGFRKGHAPTRLLERRFGAAVRNETKNQIIADAYATAIEEHELKPLSEPEPTDSLEELEIVDGKPLEFSLEVEVVPVFDLPDLDGFVLLRPTLEIAKEHIDREILRIRRELGEVKEVNDEFQPEDRIIGQAEIFLTKSKESLFQSNQTVVMVPREEDEGRGPMLGMMIDDLSEILKGTKVGDCISIKTTGPESHEREDIRGADLTIEFEISAGHRIIPTTTEDVVEKYGMENEDILQEQIKLALEQRRSEEQATVLREQVCMQLAEKVDFDLPTKLTESQSRRQLERYRLQLLYQGLSNEDVEMRMAESRGKSDSNARNQLKMFFLLQKLAEHLKVDVSEQEINSRIAMMAAQKGIRPDKLKTELVQSNRIGELASQIRDTKAADRLVKQSTLTDVTIEEWNRHLEEAKGGAADPPEKKTTKKTSSSTASPEDSKKKTTTKKKKTTKKK